MGRVRHGRSGTARVTIVVAAAVAALALPVLAPAFAQDTPAPAELALGILAPEPGPEVDPAVWTGAGSSSTWVRIPARRERIETAPGVRDWSAVRSAVAAAGSDGRHVALALVAAGPLPSPVAGTLDGWLAFVRSAARELGGAVDVFEIAASAGQVEGGGPPDPAAYAFLLKSSALALRAELRARGAEARVAQAALAADDLDTLRALWAEDVAAYVDVVPVVTPAGPGGELPAVLAENLLHPPAAEVWAYVVPRAGDDPWQACADAVRALAAGAGAALVRPAGDDATRADVARWIGRVHDLLGDEYAPGPLGPVRFERDTGGPLVGAEALGAFVRESDFRTAIVYRAPGPPAELPRDEMIVAGSMLQNLRLVDPVGDRELRVGSSPVDGGRAVRVATAPWPMVVVYDRPSGSAGFELPPEEVSTVGRREPTAEEIIARYQQVQKIQDDRLDRFTARGRIEFHFKLAQGVASVDVSIDSNYFWERGGQLEWEQTAYYVNGNRVKWKNIPELPLIQPEKVVTLPLDLHLDKTYAYRKVGRDKVAGRDAWVLEFSPVDPDAPQSLYRGRVWIDAETWERLRTSLLQTGGLESPVLSNEEIDVWAPHDADGFTYWLLGRTEGQQVWSTAGRNFQVVREVTFEEYDINPSAEEFASRRAEAYASSNQMLRDTDQGFRYLDRQPDGTRQVAQGVDSNQWFAAAGAFRDSSTDGVTPLAGVNYFDYDFAGKNIQINALFGGVVGFFTASKPDLIGERVSGTVDAAGSALFFSDKVFVGNDEIETERIHARSQNVSFRLGVPAGAFFKVNLIGDVTFRQYDEEKDARRAIDAYNNAHPGQDLTFVLPRDHRQWTGSVEVELNRRGYNLTGTGAWSKRSAWEPFGAFDRQADAFVALDPATGVYAAAEPEPLRDSFARWSVTAAKEWYLPKFQKLRAEIDWLDGSDLDRFSRYQFSLFGDDRLNGYSGSGVRFDDGWIARAGYSFNLFEAIRFDASIENAWVREGTADRQSFSGVGLSANVVGPWKTVIAASYGYALASDIPDLEGSQEFLLLVLKLF